MSFRGFLSGENYVYKLSQYLNRPALASEDFHGVYNGVYKHSRNLNRPSRALEDDHGG